MSDLSLQFSSLVERLKAIGILLSSCADGQEEPALHGAGLIVEGLAEELEGLTERLHSVAAKPDQPGKSDAKVSRLRR